MLVQAGGTNILLDGGIGVRTLQKRLSRYRITLKDLDAVLLTHEHGDHIRSVWSLSKRYGVPIIGNAATLEAVSSTLPLPSTRVMSLGESLALKDLAFESFSTSHDALDPVGYNIYHKNSKVSFLTDTGFVSNEVLEKTLGADLLIVESNHDVQRLLKGPYPWMLKNRILSDIGHLSNEAAADFILANLRSCPAYGRDPASRRDKRLPTIWLAHLSDENNSPRLARKYVQSRLSDAGVRNVVLGVALRDIPSLTWRMTPHQMSLFQ